MTGSNMMGKAVAAGVIAATASIAFAGSASADWNDPIPTPGHDDKADAIAAQAAAALGPAPMADAQVPVLGSPLGPEGLNLLGQRTSNTDPTINPAAGLLGVPTGTQGLTPDTILGQNAAPSRPGAGPGAVPNLNAFHNSYGVGQCIKPSAPGKCDQFGVDPGQENADSSPHEWLNRFVDMYHDGRLRGGSLSQWNQQQLGESLPGTAPPPGTNIPPGLVQYYEPPEVPPPPGAPVPPPPAPAN